MGEKKRNICIVMEERRECIAMEERRGKAVIWEGMVKTLYRLLRLQKSLRE